MMETTDMEAQVLETLQRVAVTKPVLRRLSTDVKNDALNRMAEAIWAQRDSILRANERDVMEARQAGQRQARIDRLMLNEQRISQMMEGLLQVAELPDPIGDVVQTIQPENGLEIEQVRVPIGLIAMIYEARPNVTVDSAGLAVKTGNAIVLRGGREALMSNVAIVEALRAGLSQTAIPEEAVTLITCTDHASVDYLIRARGLVDLAIPRGGANLIQRVVTTATVPVIETGVGNCHVYVDRHADVDMAHGIILNAKVQRPSVCNAMETLLVHQDIAPACFKAVFPKLCKHGVTLRGCSKTIDIASQCAVSVDIMPATEADYETEYLDLTLAVRVVDSLEEAIQHIEQYGTGHSEAIVTENRGVAGEFLTRVDAAAVYHNASTRFTDGFEFGFGAEIGISTQKLHARGPMGLTALTSSKYVVKGTGQIRA